MIFARNQVAVLIATIVSFGTLYIPQPMLPLMAKTFAVSAAESGLLMTAAMLPLAIAPVVYGYFLQAIPAKLMLMIALSLLAVDQLCFYFVTEFWHLLALRFIQGLLLPAIFASLMTYCATMVDAAQVRRAMGLYIGATILGGFLGRLAGGVFASHFDWRIAFVVMGFAQLLPIILLARVPTDTDINFARLDSRSIARVLRNRNYRFMFLALASVFFVYAGILNIVPFHLLEMDPDATAFLISTLYLGYLVGAPVSYFSDSISKM